MEKRKPFKKLINVTEKAAVFILSALILLYRQVLSPLTGARCRFYPTCSKYFLQSLQEWGLIRGSFYGLRRIFRCHPFCKGGFDPVENRER